MIRPAQPGDENAIFELLGQLGYTSLEFSEFHDAFKNVLADDKMGILLFVSDDKKALGVITFSVRPQIRLGGLTMSLDELSVDQRARGQGVGAALVDEVKKMAKVFGAKRLELHTNRERESYRRQFYAKLGFKEVNSALMRIEFQNES
jgi:GNAT superfamily N-acetyltransferase